MNKSLSSKYISFFRLRFACGLQYRAAAWAGIATQFTWGAMEILTYRAFYEADPNAFPISLEATVSYIWMQQAFLALFAAWMMENEIFETIMNGDIAYELCRPISIYNMWFARSLANRLSKALLRCFPILLLAVLLPKPYGICAPVGVREFVLFVISLLLGVSVTVAFCLLVYALTFFTISPDGLRILCISAIEFLSGAVVPLPFFPDGVSAVLELLPFASMQNVPLLIYSGSMGGWEALEAIALQMFWVVTLVTGGKLLCTVAERRVTIQGG